jgi:hypothetical protein
MLSILSFFSLACLNSSSRLKINGPEVGAIGFVGIFCFEDTLDILETLDFVSSAAFKRWLPTLDED